jgi:tetrahydromethanopterin S-methyltransferase subunit H
MKSAPTPTIVASMFYEGDDLVLDAEAGRIDEQRAAERIRGTNGLAAKYGVPYVLDLEIPSAASAAAILRTVARNTESPLWISSFTEEMREKAVRAAIAEGLRERVYYSTLNYMSQEDEFRAVADMGVKPIIQIFNPDNPLPEGYLTKAEEFLGLAEKVGISTKEVVLLPTILDFGSIPLALAIVETLHERYSLPVCIPSVGPVYKWAGQYSQDTRRFLLASAITYTLAFGTDLLHIGSIKRSFIAFPVVALVDKLEKRKAAFDGAGSVT